MRSHARVVVIGGGVVGASVLYHLTKAGWKDVLLVERAELTSGSTWHAAGGMHTVNGDPNVAKLQQYTIQLYKEIEEISGQSCGVHITGGVMLAGTRERLDWLKMAKARGRYLKMELEIISVDEAAKLFPLLDKKHFVGGIYDPIEGHVDPYGVTHAYAKSAQIGGAEIVRHTRVVDLKSRADGTWDVITEGGNVHAEHVVNAAGLWAREVGRMVGLELPVLAMEHQYLITGDMPELVGKKEQLHAIDFEGEIYLRQERGGMLMGTYERAGVPWSPQSTPWDFGQDLLPNDLERIAPSLAVGFEHFPALEAAGIKKVVNGPFTFAPDGNPLVGPIKGLRNFWVACGVMAGFSQGGGVGLALSRWMVDGDPGADVWGMDVARYGDWTTLAYTNAKVRENYSRRFRIRFPNEELAAAPPAAHHADLRALASRTRGVRRLLRPRTSAVVRSERARGDRRGELPALELASARGRRVPCRARWPGASGDLELRQVRRARAGCRRVAVAHDGEQGAAGRPHRPDADAQRARQADRRFHVVPRLGGSCLPGRHLRGGKFLHALVRAASAGVGCHGAAVRDGIHGSVSRGAPIARGLAESGARRFVDRGLPVLCRSGAWRSAWCRRTSGACPSRGISGSRSG